MWTGSAMVAVASDFIQIDGIERARREEVDLGGGIEEE